MQIVLNGQIFDTSEGCSITELLKQLVIDPQRVAVEVNLNIIPKAGYDGHSMADGDKVEIVHFVGGG